MVHDRQLQQKPSPFSRLVFSARVTKEEPQGQCRILFLELRPGTINEVQ